MPYKQIYKANKRFKEEVCNFAEQDTLYADGRLCCSINGHPCAMHKCLLVKIVKDTQRRTRNDQMI